MTTLTLEQRREIDLAKEALVEGAEELLRRAKLQSINRNEFGHAQLRNLAAVAAETESPKVVANFIRFQIGRAKKDQGWARPADGKRVGDLFLDELEKPSGTIATVLPRIPGCPADSVSEQLARMELIRHFIGFASRYLKFLHLDQGNGGQHS